MHHKEAKDNMLVDRYLAGRLDPRERRRFEQHYLGCELCLEDLELTEKLRAGLRDVAAHTRSDSHAEAIHGAGKIPANSNETGQVSRQAPRYAIAASIVLAASLVTVGLSHRGPGDTLVPAAAEVFPIHATRSVAGEASLIRLGSSDASAVLLVDPGRTQKYDYRISLSRLDENGVRIIAQAEAVRPSYEALIAITVPGRLLVPGPHLIAVEGRAGPDDAYSHVTELGFNVAAN